MHIHCKKISHRVHLFSVTDGMQCVKDHGSISKPTLLAQHLEILNKYEVSPSSLFFVSNHLEAKWL